MGQEPSVATASHADAVRIREALRHIVESAPFRTTHQCRALLTYVVDHTLTGEHDLLRERVVGTEVFGRSHDYAPSEDPIVRVRAAEVRRRLAQYYQDGPDCLVRIEIPPGSYKAVFRWHPAPSPAPVPVPEIEESARIRRRLSWWRWVALAVLAGTIAIAVRGLSAPPPAALDRFWAPVFASPKPVLIYNATNIVFQPSDDSGDFVKFSDQFMCVGDAHASLALASLFSRRGKVYQVRYGHDLTFTDLRYQPSILIGAFNNPWILQTTSDLRFVFEKQGAHATIRDRSNNRLYRSPAITPDGRTPEDYAIVSRIFDSKTGELLIGAGGIYQYGTRAAGEFLTSQSLMAAIAARAPRDWQKKSLQVLLHTAVVGEIPGPPTVVETYFW
jgi:hypothetical protein